MTSEDSSFEEEPKEEKRPNKSPHAYKSSNVSKGELRIRRAEIVTLRLKDGLTYQQIADLPNSGYTSWEGVRDAFNKGIEESAPVQEADQHAQRYVNKNIEDERRLDKLIEICEDKLEADPDHKTAGKELREYMDLRLKIQAAMRKLVHGLEAPVKSEITGAEGAPFEVVMAWPTPNPDTEVVKEEDLKKEGF